MYSGLLPAYLILQLSAFGFHFYDYSNFPSLINTTFGHCCSWLHTLAKTPWKGSFFHLQRAQLKQVLATFIILANKDKFKEIRGQTWQSTGYSCWPSCAMILNWSITSKTQLFSTASPVQHSCRSNIFGNSHYFRNECSCVFIANHMPALSTIREIRIQQTYSSN